MANHHSAEPLFCALRMSTTINNNDAVLKPPSGRRTGRSVARNKTLQISQTLGSCSQVARGSGRWSSRWCLVCVAYAEMLGTTEQVNFNLPSRAILIQENKSIIRVCAKQNSPNSFGKCGMEYKVEEEDP